MKINKKLMTFGILGILTLALVSAAIVGYFDKVETNVDVIAPITLDDSLFDISGETLNDGETHYLLVKGWNSFDDEVLTDIVITISKDNVVVTDIKGIHIAVDNAGAMHYCYDGHEDYDNTINGDYNCDTFYVDWLVDNQDLVSWGGNDADYVASGFVSPVNGNGWIDGSGYVDDGILSFPIGVDSGTIASIIAIRADHGLEPGAYKIEVEFRPRSPIS